MTIETQTIEGLKALTPTDIAATEEILDNWGRNIISSDHVMRLLSARVPRLIAEIRALLTAASEAERLRAEIKGLRSALVDIGHSTYSNDRGCALKADKVAAIHDTVAAALALPAPAQAEPVAWEYRVKELTGEWSQWMNTSKFHYDHLRRGVPYEAETRALGVIAAPPPQAGEG